MLVKPMTGYLVLALALAGPAAAQTGSQRAAAEAAARSQRFAELLKAAEHNCLSNTTSTQTSSLRGFFSNVLHGLSVAVGFTRQSEEIRGAARDLPARYRMIENDQIRACMNRYTAAFIGFASNAAPAVDDNAAWPEPIDVHLNLIHPADFDPRKFADTVQLNLQSTKGLVISDRLAMQDPRGLAYYAARLRYPKPGETIRGTLVNETRDGYRTNGRPPITALCFDRAPNMPPPSSVRYEDFDCLTGKTCKPSSRSARWLRACPTDSAQANTMPAGPRTLSDSPAAGAAVAGVVRDERPKWVVPSVAAIGDSNPEGVGYTIFTLETHLFRRADISAVELDLDVNGTVVLESGLEPSERPIANDPDHPLSISFALQSLDFAGADLGCDRIGVSLRPIGPDGVRHTPVRATLDYVALRDVLDRRAQLGPGTMRWSAGYVVPRREWRAIAELRSYIYPAADAALRGRAADHASADKQALDALHLVYQGLPVVGVVRPPRTIQPNGTAAFGLAAGLVRPNGQIRFTFSPADEARLAAYLYGLAGQRPDVARVIAAKPFLFQANSASRTIPGVCERRF
ncbi:MAG TPA: hypothetical protein VNT42_10995 [Sphingomonas sp.]|nr:hypothetical protein [Sphingomonas sp.]